jgi:hypothetical protein
MPPTVKTRAQLLAEFADNNTGDISALDGRDLVTTNFTPGFTTDPTPDWDNADSAGVGAFFDQGSSMQNTVTQVIWFCFSGTPHLAVWQPAWNGGPGPATVVVGVSPILSTFDGFHTYTLTFTGGGGTIYPASLLLDGATQYLTYTGTAFQTAPGAAWCFGFWFKVPSTGPVQMVLSIGDPISGQDLEVVFISGNLYYSPGTAFFAPDLFVTPPNDDLYHFIVVGFSVVRGNLNFISMDTLPLVTQALTGSPVGITGTEVSVGAQSFGGSPRYFLDGELDEMFFGTELTDAQIAALANGTKGLFYRQVPCYFAHDFTFWFSLDEPSGNRLDWVTGLALVPVGNPGTGDAICGWRYDDPQPTTFVPVSILTGPGTIDPILLPPSPGSAFSGAYIKGPTDGSFPVIPATTYTPLDFVISGAITPVRYDTDSYFAIANPTQLVAPVTGYYEMSVVVAVEVPIASPQQIQILFRKNGGLYLFDGFKGQTPALTVGATLFFQTTLPAFPLLAGDYVEVMFWAQNATTLDEYEFFMNLKGT